MNRSTATNDLRSIVQPDGTASHFALVLRLLAGYWFLHAGLAKLLAAEPFSATGWLTGAAAGTVVGPVTVWFGNNAAWFVDAAIPLGETLIGLGLLVGALTRLAAFFGAFLMAFFYLGNAGYAHGFVNGDLLGLLAFLGVAVLGAGRAYGIDALIANSRFASSRPWVGLVTSPADEPAPTVADRAALGVGAALVGLGVVVMGVVETLVGTPNPVPVTEGGEVVAATTLSPELRAATVALGLGVWFVYAVARFLWTAAGRDPTAGRQTGYSTSD
jgi:thiosulfate dehydrogenase [quinone] large subunit